MPALYQAVHSIKDSVAGSARMQQRLAGLGQDVGKHEAVALDNLSKNDI